VAVEMIFGNLLENAVKYLDPDRPGRIEVVGEARGDRNVYEIRDNGCGIATADQERVFELFRRAGNQEADGEGVGLAYVRNGVYRLGGALTLVSVVDEGTCFTIDLPALLATSEPVDAIAA
jgi:signal transduction histidine kinase